LKFLVLGDCMIDRYHRGRILRLNPESHSAPLLTCCWPPADFSGGAANVAANVRAMGAEAYLIGQSRGCIVKCRLLDIEEGVVARFDSDDELGPISAEQVASCAGYDAAIVSDYGKGSVTREVADAVRALGIPTFVDCKRRPDWWCGWAEAMCPNEQEFEQHRRDFIEAKFCLVKMGARGARLLARGVEVARSPATATCVRNVAGAGDTATAAFAGATVALAGDAELSAFEKASVPMRMAMAFAAAAVTDPMTAAPSFRDVFGKNFPQSWKDCDTVAWETFGTRTEGGAIVKVHERLRQ
jgi:bifunctional ADP-heptose synthase (sugar kinase/adenylyltransferase)